jgi:hypothetical protein
VGVNRRFDFKTLPSTDGSMDDRAPVVARIGLPERGPNLESPMKPAAIELDENALRCLLRAGGLAVSGERARSLLPLASALLASCDRLAALDLAIGGGCGPDGEGTS